VTHCLPAACLQELVVALEQQNITQLWTRPQRLPLGDGQEGMFRAPTGVLSVVAVPAGA
jgi:hypothetical protein